LQVNSLRCYKETQASAKKGTSLWDFFLNSERDSNTGICSAPTEATWEREQDKDAFWDLLNDVIEAAPSHDMKIVMGDFNVQIGMCNNGREDVMGTQALGVRNDNGDRLLSFCSTHGLKIGGSIFRHKNIHNGTVYVV